ncbi:MAG: DUF4238 domain-containing protein [Phycisphaerales bacterium]
MNQENKPRRHHYVTKSYLEGFCNNKGLLDGFDRTEQTSFSCSPRDAAVECDFFRIPEAEAGEFELERQMGELIESPGIEAIRKAVANGLERTDCLSTELLAFMALHVARVPGTLNRFTEFVEEVLKRQLWYIAQDPSLLSEIHGEVGDDELNAKQTEAREAIETGIIEPKVKKWFILSNVIKSMGPIAGALEARKWQLVRVPAEGPTFCCSDQPISLSPLDPSRMNSAYGIGLGSQNTAVTFPLDKRTLLFGTFEDLPDVDPSERWVGAVNAIAAYQSERFVYTDTAEPLATTGNGDQISVLEYWKLNPKAP